MLSKTKLLSFLMIALWSLQSCNPRCESSSQANLKMEPSIVLPGSEFLISSTPANFLEGRSVFIDDPAGTGSKLKLPTVFTSELRGVIATLPAQASQSSAIYVEDPDCSGDFIYVNDLRVENEDFFFSSDLFVVPPLPIVIIPAPPPAPPVNITNAWITPYRRSYCIWFVPQFDENHKELKELRPLREDDEQVIPEDPVTHRPKKGSHEFVVCEGTAQRHVFANVNPVSGIIDRENNRIEIRIDRTSKGLGIEHFTGMFIEPGTQIPNTPEWRNGGACGNNDVVKEDFMLLTSSSTGQQLLMIKAL